MTNKQKFIELYNKKGVLIDKLDALKLKMAKIEEALLKEFADEGMSRAAIGTTTLWLDHKVWASAGGDMDGAVSALREAGFNDLVKESINRNTLSAWVREQAPSKLSSPEEIQAALPAGVRDAIKVTETNNIRVRKS
jgi:hypothetical protein